MISVVVPIYNMEMYLARCLESLANQDSNDYEVLLIDDGSTDSVKSICKRYCEKYPDIFRYYYKENGGLSSARNYGIEYAKGEYLTFPDPDDWVENNYVSSFLKFISVNEDLVVMGHYVDWEDGRISKKASSFNGLLEPGRAIEQLVIYPSLSAFAWDKAYRADIIRSANIRFKSDKEPTEDLDFMYRYLKACNKRVRSIPSIATYHYCQRVDSVTGMNFSSRKLNGLTVYYDICQDVHNSKTRVAAKRMLFRYANQLAYQEHIAGLEGSDIWNRTRNAMSDGIISCLICDDEVFVEKAKDVLSYFMPRIIYKIKDVLRDA